MTVNEVSFGVDFDAPKDIFWPSNPSIVWSIALVRDVYPAAAATTAHAALIACAAPRSATLPHFVQQSEARPATGCKRLGLCDDLGVRVGVFGDDGLHDVGEARVLLQGVRG